MSESSAGSPVVLVSIDGLAPRVISRSTMPALTTLARQGASCFTGQTVKPSFTLPGHASMLRGVSPNRHGFVSNTPAPPADECASIFAVARAAGRSTAAFISWTELDCLVEPGAITERVVFDGGYGASDDRRTTESVVAALHRREHDLVFVYLTEPDVTGHRIGWCTDEYVRAASAVDELLAEILAATPPDAAIVVTTDHGGWGTEHGLDRPEDLEQFIVVRAPGRLAPATGWPTTSILDTAPTVADLLGIDPHPAWERESLVGTEVSVVDAVMSLLASTRHVSYGERVNMLDHALQSAALAAAADSGPQQVLACLLHDLGHILGEAGDWGLPGHAEVGARALQPLLDAPIVEPIRLHVDAKRYRVAVEPAYHDRLSLASQKSLEEQGGPLDPDTASAFAGSPFAAAALALREYDDDGKVAGLAIPPLEHYRPMLTEALEPSPPIDPRWARDACRCVECRDPGNDQHLLDVVDLDGWIVVAERAEPNYSGGRVVRLVHASGPQHDCHIPAPSATTATRRLWDASDPPSVIDGHSGAGRALFAAELAERGIALVGGLSTTEGEVLRFAAEVGFVRNTNYGDLFDVVAEPNPNNLAFTPVGLPLHTDNPYRDPTPTVQLLHCLASADGGGASHFADGIAAAAHLQISDPAAFTALTATVLTFRFHDHDVDLRAHRPMIDVSPDGTITAVAVNHRSMEAPSGDPAAIARFYDAYATYAEMLASPMFRIELTLEPGQLIGFDNRRVLHGRAGFNPTHRRHLQGCYIDIDALHSTARLSSI